MTVFTDQHLRMRRILENALEGAIYQSHREEDGCLCIEARRSAERVHLRLRGLYGYVFTGLPGSGAAFHLQRISGNFRRPETPPSASKAGRRGSFFDRLGYTEGPGLCRVELDVGGCRLQVTCEDADWWQDGPAEGDAP